MKRPMPRRDLVFSRVNWCRSFLIHSVSLKHTPLLSPHSPSLSTPSLSKNRDRVRKSPFRVDFEASLFR
ncbi:hypothetical protein Peur_017320 [Populus x canadensis]